MAHSNNWKFVTPSFMASQRIKGFKTAVQIKNFAIKNDVLCGWFKNTGSKGKHFLVEFGSFKKAIKISKPAGGITRSKWNTKKTTTRKPYKASTRKTSGYTWKTRTTARKTNNWRTRYTSRRAA